MFRLTRPASLLVAVAALSLAGTVLVYVFPPRDRATLSLVTDLCWLWASGYGAFCCFLAARRAARPEERRTWQWIGAGCASFFVGQVVWTYHDVWLGAPPSYPSLADVGYLGIYVCFIAGLATLLRAQPTRRADPELILDAVLVTFTAGALGYEFLLEPLVDARGFLTGLLTSVAWSIAGIAVLWMVLIQMLSRTAFPLTTAALVLPGVVIFAGGNLAYAVVALRGTYQTGGPLDLTWVLGLLLIAAAAAVAPERGGGAGAGAGAAAGAAGIETEAGPPALSGLAARTVAIVVGLAGMAALAIVGVLRPSAELDVVVLVGLGMLIIAARVTYSLGADRRYARLLEEEVAAQTRSLMSALSATAAAEHSLRLVMEAVPDAILVLDRDGHVLDGNAAGRAMAVPPADPVNLGAAFAGELRRFEIPFRRDDGTEGVSAVLYAPVREGARVRKVLALARDITEQRRTQAQLHQAEKLAAMGQLVSGVAHEINNPAAIISGFAQTLLLDELPPEQRETIQMIYDEATRIGRITSSLLAFARAGGKERAFVDLNDIVRRTFALRSYHLTTLNITVTLDLDPSDPKAWANGAEMQQMLVNLLSNAEQALTTVDTRRAITLRTVAFDDRLRLQVADTGPGMPPDIQGKIFDPFFTTKPEGKGTGLGLSICYGLVHDLGGRIWVESEPGCGAVFTVELPRDQRIRQRLTPPPMPALRVPRDDLAVLLVDDEDGLRRAVVSFLKRRGIRAVAVGDGGDALKALATEAFDVILSDVRMPGMSGHEFLERLRRDHPAMVTRLILSTGDTLAPDTAALLQAARVPTLVKPFDFAQLEALVREIAAGAKTARARTSA
ncbi:MAG TPA: ATP-binding protein [Gemmatimonadales bacterium]|nr:ATP-binding protein [Gemmatimonadales bacterium]